MKNRRRSPQGERRLFFIVFDLFRNISIHALLAESDPFKRSTIRQYTRFLSTLSLRRATKEGRPKGSSQQFLSTLSLRRATNCCVEQRNIQPLISIHALLAESDRRLWEHSEPTTLISIHALLAESDKCSNLNIALFSISIHALLAESDHPHKF